MVYESEILAYVRGMPYSGVTATPAPSPGNGSTGLATRDQLESVARPASATQAQIAGDRELLGLVYGQVRLGAKIVTAIDYQGDLLLLAAFAYGPNTALDQFYAGNEPLPAGVTVTTYLGTATGAIDSTLAAAFAAKGLTYADALPYVTCAVLRFPTGIVSGFPQITARVTGRKVYDDRDGAQSFADPTTWAYSANPSLCLADFIRGSWGMNAGASGIESATVEAAADANDVTISGYLSRTINLALDRQQPAKQWVAALRTYANVWVVPVGSGGEAYKFIIDAAGSSVASFGTTTIKQGSLSLRKQSLANTPTVIEVIYTDTTVIPYRDGSAYAPLGGTPVSGAAYRLSQVRLPGINSHQEAYRVAVERYNDFTLNDLTGEFMGFDIAAKCEVGDIIDITDPIGVTAKLVRIVKPVLASAGRYKVQFREFDPAKYSTGIVLGPTYPDTTLAPPGTPPAPTSLTLEEEVYQVEAYGGYASRIYATWTRPVYGWIGGYQVTVADTLGNVVWTGIAPVSASPSFRTGALQEGVTYTVSVQTSSLFGTLSTDILSGTITAQGKLLPPGDVSALSGFEAGGKVHLSWTQAIDIDIKLYELRYGSTGGSWDTATVIERINALTYVAQTIPPGTWRFYVKAVDSAENYSDNPAIKDITVTIDSSSFLANSYTFTSPTLQYMTAWVQRSDPNPYWTSDFGDGIGYGHDDTNNSTGIFGDSLAAVPLATPHSTGTSTGSNQWLSEVWDVGLQVSGTWQAALTITDHAGTSQPFIDISTSASTGPFTTTTGTSVLANGRWARIGVYGTGAFTVSGGPTLSVSVVPRREFGITTSATTGPVTVNLANEYFLAKSIQVTSQGTSVVNPTYDNVIVGIGTGNSFDIYAFNSAGTQVAAPCSWIFEGVN